MCPRSLSTGADRRTATASRLWLLLIGVDRYEDERLPALHYCAADCQGLADALMDATQETVNRQLFVHHDFSGELPSAKHVAQSLETIVEAARPGDRVIFYFCGHGALDRTSGRAFLCLSDTYREHLATTGLDLVDLVDQLGRCAARERFVLLDACHSGALTVAGTPAIDPLDSGEQIFEVLRDYASRSKGFYAMLSCQENERSWEFDALRHGVFTYFLMRGLRGEAANTRGAIDIDDLYRFVYHRTLRYIDNVNQQIRLLNLQKIQRGEVELLGEYPLQTPKRIVNLAGEVVIGTRPNLPPDQSCRRALVLAGRSGETAALALGRLLGSVGGFDLTYWPQPGQPWSEVHQAVRDSLRDFAANPTARGTLLLYLQGRIEVDAGGETWLVLSDEFRLSPSWLRRRLRQAAGAQQIVVLDCPQTEALSVWIEELTHGGEAGQCLLAAASPPNDPEQFARTLVEILTEADPQNGLTAARCIAQLQVRLVKSGVALYPVLIGGPGVIDVLPQESARAGAVAGDLNLCPYMGLRAFGENDAAYYFGREGLVDELVQRLARESFLAVVGASGSGKSSLVQAGLVARLRQGRQLPGSEQWWLGVIRPGAEPIKALCRRLTTSDGEAGVLEGQMYLGPESFVHWLRGRSEPIVVLVIDQFEELFTLTPPRERQEFLDLLLAAVHYAGDRFKLVITLRFDFAEACLEVPALEPLLRTHTQIVSPLLSEEDYRRVITEPARLVNLQVEPELTEVLLQELSRSAGDLPLLEFVLEQLWELRVRSEGRLTLATYQQQIGGLRGALERKAQSVFESLDQEAQQCAQWLFLSLTQLGEGKEDTRRRVLRSELVVERYQAALVDRTLSVLTAAKLVVVGRDETPDSGRSREGTAEVETMLAQLKREVTVEVAHEILIRYWSTLRSWLDENRKRLRIQREIEQAAALWKQKGEDPDSVLQGLRLAEAEALYGKYADELSPEVRRFVEACFQKRETLKAQEKRRLRGAQIAAGVMGVLGVVALGFGGLAYMKVQEVQRSQIRSLNASAEGYLFRGQQLEALLSSVRARELLQRTLGIDGSLRLETDSTLRQMLYEVQEYNRLKGHGDWIPRVRYSPDGQLLASASGDKTVRLWNTADGTLNRILRGHSEEVRGLAFSPNGQLLATSSRDNTIWIWRVSDGAHLRTLKGHGAIVYSIAFSPNGQLLASSSRDKTVRLWRVSDGAPLSILKGHRDLVFDVGFSPDGTALASASWDGTIRLWRTTDGAPIKTLVGHSGSIYTVVFSRDGRTLASGDHDGTVILWSMAGDGPPRKIKADKGAVTSLGFSPDGKVLASASDDGKIQFWGLDGRLLGVLKQDDIGVDSISFSPDGQSLASSGGNNVIQLWKLKGMERNAFLGHGRKVTSLGFSPDGELIASGGMDSEVKLWSSGGTLLTTLHSSGTSPVFSVAFSPDGRILASDSGGDAVSLWNVASHSLLKRIANHRGPVMSVDFSSDSKMLATASTDRTVQLWNVADGKRLAVLLGHRNVVYAVRFSPSSDALVSADGDGRIILWSARTGKQRWAMAGHGGKSALDVRFSPDGKTIVSAGADGEATLWDVATGKSLVQLPHGGGFLIAAGFSPDGQVVATAGGDKNIRLWSARDGRLLAILKGHTSSVLDISFKPGSRTIASAGEDSRVMVWNWTEDSNGLLRKGCERLRGYLKTNPDTDGEGTPACTN